MMPRAYDFWDKLVGAVFKREKLRQLAFAESLSSSSSSNSAKSSSDSSREDVPVHDVPAVKDEKTMPKVSDNWERLVGAVLRREELRQLVFSESSSSISSNFSFDYSLEDVPAVKDEKTMPNVSDNWERLVGAVLRREELRQLVFSESSSSFSSNFSFDYSLEDVPAVSRISIDPAASSIQSNFSYHNARPIELTEIKKATKNFQPDMMFEQGEFGQYFKGWVDELTLTASVPGSGMPVAVKKCHQERLQGHQEFLEEVNYLSQLHHPNLVKLIGYCSEEDNMILVYEFIPNGKLEHHLFTRGHQSLSWGTRINVAIGAARGLSFLHEKEIPVLLGSFTSDAILLDEEFNAKLSDLCLTREDPFPQMTDVQPRVVGYSYAAPEYIATGELTTKYEVFGFGVVLLELLSGLQSYIGHPNTEEQTLVEWAKPYLGSKRKLFRIMDARLEGRYPRKGAYKVAKLASQCLSLDPQLRPRMDEVVTALQQLGLEGQYPRKGAYKVVKLALQWLSPR